MHLVTVLHAGSERVGRIVDDAVHLLPAGVTMLDLLRTAGPLVTPARDAAEDPEAVALQSVRLLAPVPQPPSIRDFMAFHQHVEGVAMLMGDGVVGPEFDEFPAFYFTNPHAVVGPYDDIPVPPDCHVLDFELEVAAVIGRDGFNLSVEEAAEHIAGYTVLNDWSARDVQGREMRAHLGPAKGKDTATTLGPALVTPDELADRTVDGRLDLALQVRVNGELVGEDTLANMAWTFAELISYASRGTWVRAGDVIGSGTCGNGCLAELWGRQGRDSRPPLAVGDLVELDVERLGRTANRIVAGVAAQPLVRRDARTRRAAKVEVS